MYVLVATWNSVADADADADADESNCPSQTTDDDDGMSSGASSELDNNCAGPDITRNINQPPRQPASVPRYGTSTIVLLTVTERNGSRNVKANKKLSCRRDTARR